MNSEQLQDWLIDLNEECKADEKSLKEVDSGRNLLLKQVKKAHFLVNFLYSSYSEMNIAQAVLAQLLASFYRGGLSRFKFIFR